MPYDLYRSMLGMINKRLIQLVLAAMPVTFFIPVLAQVEVAEYPRKITCDVDGVSSLEAPAATSACGAVGVRFEETIFSGGCLGTLVRTYTYSDPCGNTAEAQQYITLTDTTPPVIYGGPADIELTRGESIPPAPALSARDNSGSMVEVTLTEVVKEGSVVRTWTSSDPCGNQARHEQVIRIR